MSHPAVRAAAVEAPAVCGCISKAADQNTALGLSIDPLLGETEQAVESITTSERGKRLAEFSLIVWPPKGVTSTGCRKQSKAKQSKAKQGKARQGKPRASRHYSKGCFSTDRPFEIS